LAAGLIVFGAWAGAFLLTWKALVHQIRVPGTLWWELQSTAWPYLTILVPVFAGVLIWGAQLRFPESYNGARSYAAPLPAIAVLGGVASAGAAMLWLPMELFVVRQDGVLFYARGERPDVVDQRWIQASAVIVGCDSYWSRSRYDPPTRRHRLAYVVRFQNGEGVFLTMQQKGEEQEPGADAWLHRISLIEPALAHAGAPKLASAAGVGAECLDAYAGNVSVDRLQTFATVMTPGVLLNSGSRSPLHHPAPPRAPTLAGSGAPPASPPAPALRPSI